MRNNFPNYPQQPPFTPNQYVHPPPQNAPYIFRQNVQHLPPQHFQNQQQPTQGIYTVSYVPNRNGEYVKEQKHQSLPQTSQYVPYQNSQYIPPQIPQNMQHNPQSKARIMVQYVPTQNGLYNRVQKTQYVQPNAYYGQSQNNQFVGYQKTQNIPQNPQYPPQPHYSQPQQAHNQTGLQKYQVQIQQNQFLTMFDFMQSTFDLQYTVLTKKGQIDQRQKRLKKHHQKMIQMIDMCKSLQDTFDKLPRQKLLDSLSPYNTTPEGIKEKQLYYNDYRKCREVREKLLTVDPQNRFLFLPEGYIFPPCTHQFIFPEYFDSLPPPQKYQQPQNYTNYHQGGQGNQSLSAILGLNSQDQNQRFIASLNLFKTLPSQYNQQFKQ